MRHARRSSVLHRRIAHHGERIQIRHALVDAELSLLASLRDASVRQVALRASGLSPESIDAIVEMIERVRKLEGLSGPNGNHHDEDGSSRGD